jgi:hypothetical protein
MGSPGITISRDQRQPGAGTTSRRHRPSADANRVLPVGPRPMSPSGTTTDPSAVSTRSGIGGAS